MGKPSKSKIVYDKKVNHKLTILYLDFLIKIILVDLAIANIGSWLANHRRNGNTTVQL